MTRPNLFDFATSELSQDAFLCWLIAQARYEDDAKLQTVGRAFIAWLWGMARQEQVGPEDVRLLAAPEQQADHIDILFEADVAGRRAVFVIEDKTDTSQHSGQLEKYKDVAGKRSSEVVLVYFKTGFHFGIDKDAAKHGYAVIGLREWVTFLDQHAVHHDVFRDYREYVSRLLKDREDALAALDLPGGHQMLGKGFVQFEFIERLASRCPETIGGSAINRGTNMGGTPWTHYRFASFGHALPGGIGEVLFHRVDARNEAKRKPAYYLSTRQYAVVKSSPSARKEKLLRLERYRDAFKQAVAQAGGGLAFSRPAGDNQGANESEIGILFFDSARNSVSAVLERFALVHRAFLTRIQESPPQAPSE